MSKRSHVDANDDADDENKDEDDDEEEDTTRSDQISHFLSPLGGGGHDSPPLESA